MVFFEGLGRVLGGMAAQAEQLQKQINIYRPEYEGMSNSLLKEEAKKLKGKGGSESRARSFAIAMILKERGDI